MKRRHDSETPVVDHAKRQRTLTISKKRAREQDSSMANVGVESKKQKLDDPAEASKTSEIPVMFSFRFYHPFSHLHESHNLLKSENGVMGMAF
jgi:hypothetical protein